MLRQLRLEMSLSQCGLAHTYPASETPHHCPGAPPSPPPLLFTDSAKRENDRGIYDTSLQGTLPPSKESTLNNKLAAFIAVSFAVIFVSQDLIGIGYQALLSILYTTSAVIDSLQVGYQKKQQRVE